MVFQQLSNDESVQKLESDNNITVENMDDNADIEPTQTKEIAEAKDG